MPRRKTHDLELDCIIETTVKATLTAAQDRSKKPYDGVLGTLPAWVPPHFHIEFEDARNQLLRKVSHGEILSYLKEFDRYFEQKYDGRPRFPIQYTKLIGTLHYYQKSVSLGRKEGLRFLAGEKAVKGEQFSSGGTSKQGKEYEPKASIRKICTRIKSTKFGDVMNALRDDEACADLYESTRNPIGVKILGVYDEEEQISYLKRGQPPDKPKKITFGRLRSILTEIKKVK